VEQDQEQEQEQDLEQMLGVLERTRDKECQVHSKGYQKAELKGIR
jgi:hypothetical protein